MFSQAASRTQLAMTPLRFFSHPQWNRKTIPYFKPKWFDNPNHNLERRWDFKRHHHMYNTQDPLFFDYDRITINGGIQTFIDKIRSGGKTQLPVHKRAYVLYHAAK